LVGEYINIYIVYVSTESVDFRESDDPHRLPRIMNQRESIPEYARLGESVDFFALNSHNNLHLFFLSFIFFLVFNEFFSFLFFLFGAKFRVSLSIVAKKK
jgi:hypothetical protein